ncbi:MAG: T9SS type A sorting domain-containing protein, partial [Ignavibacteriae bacterium]|nr:T9SS type A sorting domain-containing protein [Ignavibacteriota bacterium]
TNIKYSIPENGKQKMENGVVTLKIYDILGKEIETLVNEKQDAGIYEVTFDGNKLASGIYFYKLQSGDFVETKKMILLK